MPSQNENPFYTKKTITKSDKKSAEMMTETHRIITLSGLAQLVSQTKKGFSLGKNNKEIFVINSPEDIEALIKLIPANSCYAVILQARGQTHKTPILVHRHRFLVLDSLGQAPSFHEIKAAIEACYPESRPPEILFSAHQRQSDMFNCGSDAFEVTKQALALGSKLIDEQKERGEKFCHPALAKLTQSVARMRPLTRKGVVSTYQDVEPMSTLVVNPETGRGTTLTNHFNNPDMIVNGKYNLLLDQLAAENFMYLDTIFEGKSSDELACTAETAFPLHLLEKVSLVTLRRFFKTPEERQAYLDEALALKSSYPGACIFHLNLLKDPVYLHTKHADLSARCRDLESRYAGGEQAIRLRDIAQLKYALAYLEMKLSQLDALEKPAFEQKENWADNAHLVKTPERVRSQYTTPNHSPDEKATSKLSATPSPIRTPRNALYDPPGFNERQAAETADEGEWGCAATLDFE